MARLHPKLVEKMKGLAVVFKFVTLAAQVAQCLPAAGNDHAPLVHEKRDGPPQGWAKVRRARADAPINLRIGLKQRNIKQAEETLRAISDPESD